MRKLLQKLFRSYVIKLARRFSSKPDEERIHKSLTELYKSIQEGNKRKGLTIRINNTDKFIILSDQHKGCKDAADDFSLSEKNYITALNYYYKNNYHFISLGDSEELWENTLASVKNSNAASFAIEKMFAVENRFIKVFGNHDLYWDNDPFASFQLESIYSQKVDIYEGALLEMVLANEKLEIFLTHGHQGDLQSDGNWFSKWFVAQVWAPVQAYLNINPNTPAYNVELKTEHNRLMYEWSSKHQKILLITGHTHQPVFESLTQLEKLYKQLSLAMKQDDKEAMEKVKSKIKVRIREGDALPDFSAVQPRYFNSGCCCFDDGDITGIEISDDAIRLIKWEYDDGESSRRLVLEESLLTSLIS